MPQKKSEIKMQQLNQYRHVTVKRIQLSEGFECSSFVGEKRGSAKVENNGQVHDIIVRKCFLIEG